MPKAKIRYVLFWFKSNKGSDLKRVFKTKLSNKEIQARHEDWSEYIIRNGPYSESVIRHGYRFIKMPARSELLKRYHSTCNKQYLIRERLSIQAAMLSPDDMV